MALHESEIELSELDGERILEQWSWLVRGMRLVAMNAFGDLFLVDPSGSVHMLDVALGELHPIASTVEELQEKAKDPGTAEKWFMPKLVEEARSRGLQPDDSQCLSFRKPIALGGTLSVDNLQVMNALAYHMISSRLNDERRKRPIGPLLDGFGGEE